MAKGMWRVAGLAAVSLALSGCSRGVNWIFQNDTAEAITIERGKKTWAMHPVKLAPGRHAGEIPHIKDELRIMAGACTYSYGLPWEYFPAGSPMTPKPEWREQWSKNPSAPQAMVRLEKDFSLHLYHLEADQSVGEEITENAFPRTPEKTCNQ